MPDARLVRAAAELLAAQSASGAFPSTVEAGGERQADETCFVTAQVALILGELSQSGAHHAGGAVRRAWERALDFVEACASPDVAGAFLFYPATLPTPRLPVRLMPDGDDTALAWLALMQAGRRPRALARAVLPPLFDHLRVAAARRGDPPWIRAGAYRTWFALPDGANPVDIAVNVNILACLADAGCAAPPQPDPAAAIVTAACRTADLSVSSLRSLAPFYADPAEVEIALERAVRLGAAGMTAAWRAVRKHGLQRRDRLAGRPPDRPLYCNAHGRPIWRAPSLQLARRCRDLPRAPMDISISSPSVTGGHHVHA
jgi:hypothetical protein